GGLMATAGAPRIDAGEARLREEIARFCRVTWDRGLVSAAGGNLSARLGAADLFLITPSGVALRDTEPSDLVTIDLAGRKVAGPDRYVPSKEMLMHTAVYAARPATRAVAHLHPPHAIAFGIRGEPIPLMTVTSEERLLLTMRSHTGTHVDALYHFLADGPRLGDVPLDRMVGEALVADLRGRPTIDAAALADVDLRPGDILLCRTDNSQRWEAAEFQRDFVYLTEEAAR